MENYNLGSFGDMPISALNYVEESPDIETLAHHGIPGMKWGVRRYQNKDGTLTAAGKKRYDKLNAELEKLSPKKSESDSNSNTKKADIKDMTDDEIKEKTNRLTLEKNLRQAEKDWDAVMKTPVQNIDKKKTNKGREIVLDMLEKGARNIGGQLVTYVMGVGVNKALSSTFKDDAIVNPKKGQKDK